MILEVPSKPGHYVILQDWPAERENICCTYRHVLLPRNPRLPTMLKDSINDSSNKGLERHRKNPSHWHEDILIPMECHWYPQKWLSLAFYKEALLLFLIFSLFTELFNITRASVLRIALMCISVFILSPLVSPLNLLLSVNNYTQVWNWWNTGAI